MSPKMENILWPVLRKFYSSPVFLQLMLDSNACSSCRDMTFQVTALDNSADAPIKVNAHAGPLLSVTIDPLKEFIATSGCDGHVCIWSFSKPQTLVKKWSQVFPASNDITTSTTLCRMAWYPSAGKHLAIPFKDKVFICSKGDWEEVNSLSCAKLTKVRRYT